MKQSDLQKCCKCRQGLMHTGVPLFWRITVERFGVDMAAVQRRHGMELMMGGGTVGAVLAGAMGPNDDIAKLLGEKLVLCMCETCALENFPVAALAELAPVPITERISDGNHQD